MAWWFTDGIVNDPSESSVELFDFAFWDNIQTKFTEFYFKYLLPKASMLSQLACGVCYYLFMQQNS